MDRLGRYTHQLPQLPQSGPLGAIRRHGSAQLLVSVGEGGLRSSPLRGGFGDTASPDPKNPRLNLVCHMRLDQVVAHQTEPTA